MNDTTKQPTQPVKDQATVRRELIKDWKGRGLVVAGGMFDNVLVEVLNHFEEHNKSANLVGEFYSAAMEIGLDKQADWIKTIASHFFAINLKWDKEKGKLEKDASYTAKKYAKVTPEEREQALKDIKNTGAKALYKKLTAKPAPAPKKPIEQVEAAHEAITKQFKTMNELQDKAKLDPEFARDALSEFKKVQREIETLIESFEAIINEVSSNAVNKMIDDSQEDEESKAA